MRLVRTVRAVSARGLAVVCFFIILSPPAAASVMRFMPVEELARSSSLVVRARITGQSVHWTPAHEGIYTQIEALVTGEILTEPGRPAGPGRRVTIIQAGGEIDGVSLDWTGRPTFRDGEELVLFLRSYEPADRSDPRLLVVGGKQGRMRVVEPSRPGDDIMVERDLQGVLEAPAIEGDRPNGPAPRRDLIRLEELRQRVLAARGVR